eukprot:gene37327-46058_t
MEKESVSKERLLLMAGCASLSPDGGLNDVSRLTQERIGQPAAFAKPTAQEAGAGNAQRGHGSADRLAEQPGPEGLVCRAGLV